MRLAASELELEKHGYDVSRIGTHSLRSGGAMALKLNGYDDTLIRKLGRWRSDTFIHYIQSQIAELTAGVATAMSRLMWFHNVA